MWSCPPPHSPSLASKASWKGVFSLHPSHHHPFPLPHFKCEPEGLFIVNLDKKLPHIWPSYNIPNSYQLPYRFPYQPKASYVRMDSLNCPYSDYDRLSISCSRDPPQPCYLPRVSTRRNHHQEKAFEPRIFEVTPECPRASWACQVCQVCQSC